MAEKRKRGQNFSLEEKDKLIKILITYKDTILNKKTDGTTNEAKNMAWISVTNTFNSTALIYRNKESLMKVWEKLKSESKLYYNNTKQSWTKTGGGPSNIKIDPVLEQVCALLGRSCTGILGVSDCDADEETSVQTLPKIICLEDAPTIQHNVKHSTETVDTHLPPEEEKHISECTTIVNDPKTSDSQRQGMPLWSRRRPQISQKNERTEAVSSLCTSFQNVNKKRENIEDLKLQLLENEINFKNQLYAIQIETAKKELAIKTAIWEQVKGGALNLQSFFGVSQSKNE